MSLDEHVDGMFKALRIAGSAVVDDGMAIWRLNGMGEVGLC